MKKNFYLLLLTIAAAVISCQEKGNIPAPGDYTNTENRPLKFAVDDTTGFVIPEGAITTREANEICKTLASGATTTDEYIVVGVVKNLVDKYTSTDACSFYMVSYEHPYSIDAMDQFYAFKVKNIGGTSYESAGYGVEPGNAVVIKAKLTNYNGTLESAQGGVLLATTFKEKPVETVGQGTLESPYTVADVIALGGKKNMDAYVRAYIVGAMIDEMGELSAENIEFNAPTTKASNILLADQPGTVDPEGLVPAEVPSRRGAYGDIYQALNLNANPANLGQSVLLYGALGKFEGKTGVISITFAKIGDSEYGQKPE